MNLQIRCKKCGSILDIKDSHVDPLGTIIVEVETCPNLDCRDCGECDVDQKLIAAEKKLDHLKENENDCEDPDCKICKL